METFLEKTAKYVMDRFPVNRQEICVVLPNRRAGLFLKQNISTLIDKPVFAPGILSIEDFVYSVSGFTEIDPVHLLFEFYETYKQIAGTKAEEFTEFLRWADVVLRDFNDLDLYLIDPDELFGHLSESKAMALWNPDGKPLTEFEKGYLHFYNSLARYYKLLKENLKNRGQVYQGLAYRTLTEICLNKIPDIPWKFILFAGFNALSKSEEELFNAFVKEGRGEMFWDADSYYYQNPVQEAGYFLRKNKKLFKDREFNWVNSFYKDQAKNITTIGVAMNTGQVKAAGELLLKITSDKSKINKTALILNDESLLIPLLNSLPDTIDDFNVTMGLNIKNTALFRLVEAIFRLNDNALKFQKNNSNDPKIYYKDIVHILDHVYISRLFSDLIPETKSIELKKLFMDSNKVLFSPSDLNAIFDKSKNIPVFLKKIITPFGHDIKLGILRIKEFLKELKIHFSSSLAKAENDFSLKLNLEYIFHFSRLFNQLESYLDSYSYIRNFKTFRKLFNQVSRSISIPFYGEPLKGVQIMGMLESRTLDFENIILLSVNENFLPSSSASNSIIPFEIRRNFKLPTHRERNAVFSYHFYRLLQRAQNVYLLYTTEAGDLGGGEASRFLKQILYELPKFNPSINIEEKIVTFPVDQKHIPEPIVIHKSQEILSRLDELAIKGFSASGLNTYRNCSLQFYFNNVAGIKETDEVEETIESSTLGTVVHDVLQKIYTPFKSKILKENDFSIGKDKISELIRESFLAKYPGGEIDRGKNHLIVNVAESFVENFLQKEKQDVAANSKTGIELVILELEKWIEAEFSFNHNGDIKNVKLKGIVDRIDQLNDTIRIIDYKTGRLEKRDLKFTDWEELIDNSELAKVFQVLFYNHLYTRTNENVKNTEAGIISLRSLKQGFMDVAFPDDTANPFEHFENTLRQIFSSIYDDSIPFEQTSEIEDCKYCPFKSVCNR
ncbi:MAG: PD-(D/E)XK nuclease family protein [Bacteroidales bacterium]